MTTQRVFMAGLAVSLASAASGQLTAKLTYTIEWNSGPQPGVAAKGAVYATIDPEIGKEIQWFTPPGTGQLGTLKAFASSIFNFVNVENGETGTLSWTVPASFNIANKPGTPDGSGGILGVNAGQFGPPVNTNPVVTNKVKLLDLEWLTTDFTMRAVEFKTNATSGKVYLDIGLTAWVGQNAELVNGSGGFFIFPSPSGGVVLGVGMLAMVRRRRE